ncbi:MAG: hypothetical protein Q9218_004033 [Villophora microphyllina]
MKFFSTAFYFLAVPAFYASAAPSPGQLSFSINVDEPKKNDVPKGACFLMCLPDKPNCPANLVAYQTGVSVTFRPGAIF